METNTIIGLIGITVLLLIFFNGLATKELIDYPLCSQSKKILWFLLIWFVPILGLIIVHRVLKIGWASSSTTGGDGSILPPDGGNYD